MEKKKLKLTISGSSKKTISNIELAKSQAKNSVVIEKKNKRFGPKSSFSYKIIQNCAKESLAKNKNLKDVVLKNQLIMNKISRNKINSIFNYYSHFKNINLIFKRVFK